MDKVYDDRDIVCAAQFGDYFHLADGVDYLPSSLRVDTEVAHPLPVPASTFVALDMDLEVKGKLNLSDTPPF